MGSDNNFTTDISEWLHITRGKEAYRSTNKLNYIRQMFKHNDRSTRLDYMEETLSYLALQGWYDIDLAKVFNLLYAANRCHHTIRAILHASSILRMSHFSAPCHHRYIIWEKCMSAECSEVSNRPYSEMHQKISEFQTLYSYSVHKLKRTGDTKLVDWCLDVIRMYSFTVCVLNFKMGCRTTVNHFTALHRLSVWDLIAR